MSSNADWVADRRCTSSPRPMKKAEYLKLRKGPQLVRQVLHFDMTHPAHIAMYFALLSCLVQPVSAKVQKKKNPLIGDNGFITGYSKEIIPYVAENMPAIIPPETMLAVQSHDAAAEYEVAETLEKQGELSLAVSLYISAYTQKHKLARSALERIRYSAQLANQQKIAIDDVIYNNFQASVSTGTSKILKELKIKSDEIEALWRYSATDYLTSWQLRMELLESFMNESFQHEKFVFFTEIAQHGLQQSIEYCELCNNEKDNEHKQAVTVRHYKIISSFQKM